MKVTGGEDPKEKKAEPKLVGGAHNVRVRRNRTTGTLEQEGDVTPTEVYNEDYRRAREAKEGSGTFDGSAAPRVGGVKVEKTTPPVKGGTKSQVKSSARKIKRSSMSSKQKKSALRALNS